MFYPYLYSERERRKALIRDNQRKGRIAEEIVRMRYMMMGYEVERTGRGHDFYVKKRDILTGKVIDRKFIEVKSGEAKLSKLQQKIKRKKNNYKVERINFLFW